MWDYKDYLDGLLEYEPSTHKTIDMPTDLPRVNLEDDHIELVP